MVKRPLPTPQLIKYDTRALAAADRPIYLDVQSCELQ